MIGGHYRGFFIDTLKNKKNASVRNQAKHTDNDMYHALEKLLINALPTLRHQYLNIECTGLISYYTPTISIKKNMVFIECHSIL